jgi:hypothetical protein
MQERPFHICIPTIIEALLPIKWHFPNLYAWLIQKAQHILVEQHRSSNRCIIVDHSRVKTTAARMQQLPCETNLMDFMDLSSLSTGLHLFPLTKGRRLGLLQGPAAVQGSMRLSKHAPTLAYFRPCSFETF